ncbi:MAG: hypothetical protein CSA81_07920 [Acidobacteria bacterium]|nr:MAG: hypothetical protein CSA81_07920 [Acidobacteriota bacterium]
MKTQVLRGKLEPLGLIKVLAYISSLQETGYLRVKQNDIEKTLIIKKGEIIFAKSNLPIDRLGDMLLHRGMITQEQYTQASQLIAEKGYRHGRSLVEIRAITPKLLWDAIEKQIRAIAYSVIPWEEGEFEFVRQQLKAKEKITLRLSILEIVMDVVRHYDSREVFLKKFPDLKSIPVVLEIPDRHIALEAHERHILDLIDDKTCLSDLCESSDFGLEEGLRTVFLLQILGIVELISKQKPPHVTKREQMVEHYNEIYAYIHRFLAQHMGHVAHTLLKKYYKDVQIAQEAVFGLVDVNDDGTLNAPKLVSNLEKAPIAPDFLDSALQEALEEYLYSGILALKRTLGTDQETIALKQIQEMQEKW